MRRLIAFPCAGETLVGSLDEAPGTTGLLIVSGGNEVRMGAHRGMAMLAARLAEAGHPVFRFDRRGIGDSTGENQGFESSAEDIAAAAAAFREAGVERIVAFGNCDAATALAFFHRLAGIDALILANPWVIEASDDLPPAAAIRARYAERMRDPKEWLRLARGGVSIIKLFKGLAKSSQRKSEARDGLAPRLATALAATNVPITLLLAQGDNTALAFADALKGRAFDPVRPRLKLEQLDSASHSFASVSDKDWLFERILAALA
ncbi:hydrolase 1, exosortase A system-associated [Sphingomonas sp. M1-B02]|uniref:hydrolase 1, exosortase A system-associated n=1 Tax=Sphingomonas sp. M1-B02 TaxID=3114300 RepID=UPI00223F6736|nr:hydrolase 1, exosortase A system-associated [Sphingomonas sp. S6-11]UZK66484.1 hydrolase 1, exosortase A system-associated [Sphingomonas sp. S6-11]